MDQVIATIAGALAAGAAAAGKDVATQAVKDAYTGLKSLVLKRYGSHGDVEPSLQEVEQHPESRARRDVLEEELACAGASQDADFLTEAKVLIDQLRKHGIVEVSVNVARLDGSGAIAQGKGAVAAGAGGIAIGRAENSHGNFSTGKTAPEKGPKA